MKWVLVEEEGCNVQENLSCNKEFINLQKNNESRKFEEQKKLLEKRAKTPLTTRINSQSTKKFGGTKGAPTPTKC